MGTKVMKIAISLFVFSAAMMVSSLAMAAKIKVELEVASSGGVDTLQVKNNGKPCDINNDKDPCIDVAQGSSPFIIFDLPDACDEGGPNYKLANIRITMIDKDWPTPDDPLNKKVANDFKADPNTGIIQFDSGNNKKTPKKLKFKNRNKYAYTVFYEITAQHCDDSSDADNIFLDPEIRNRGKN